MFQRRLCQPILGSCESLVQENVLIIVLAIFAVRYNGMAITHLCILYTTSSILAGLTVYQKVRHHMNMNFEKLNKLDQKCNST